MTAFQIFQNAVFFSAFQFSLSLCKQLLLRSLTEPEVALCQILCNPKCTTGMGKVTLNKRLLKVLTDVYSICKCWVKKVKQTSLLQEFESLICWQASETLRGNNVKYFPNQNFFNSNIWKAHGFTIWIILSPISNISTSYVTLGKFLNLSKIQVSSFEKFQ